MLSSPPLARRGHHFSSSHFHFLSNFGRAVGGPSFPAKQQQSPICHFENIIYAGYRNDISCQYSEGRHPRHARYLE